MVRHKKWILLDNFKRKMFLKYFVKRLILKSVRNATTISNSRRYLAYMQLVRTPKFSAANFSNIRCIKTGRVWGVNKKTKLSRFEFRSTVYQSKLPGFRRAS